jgi:hypothetical protein
MTQPIKAVLDNPLIRRYFDGQGMLSVEGSFERRWEIAYKVLMAMTEPIKDDDRCLWLMKDDWVETSWGGPEHTSFHPVWLRLPDAHQPKKECPCQNPYCKDTHPKPDPVKQLSREISDIYRGVAFEEDTPITTIDFRRKVMELVDAVRQESKGG